MGLPSSYPHSSRGRNILELMIGVRRCAVHQVENYPVPYSVESLLSYGGSAVTSNVNTETERSFSRVRPCW